MLIKWKKRSVLLDNKNPVTAQVGAGCVAQNSHKAELIFMFEKNVNRYIFWFEIWENIAYAGTRLTTCRFGIQNWQVVRLSPK